MTAATTTPVADLEDPLGLAAIEAELEWQTSGPLPSWLDGTELSEAESLALPPMLRSSLAEARIETLAEVGDKTEPRVDMSASDLAASEPAGPAENRASSSMEELLDLVNLVSLYSTGYGDPTPPVAAAPPPSEIIAPVAAPASFGSSHVMDSEPRDAGSSSAITEKEPLPADLLPLESSTPPNEAPQAVPPNEPAPIAKLPPRRVPSLDELAEARDCLIVEAGDRFWAVPLHAVVCLKPWPASPADIDVDLAEELGAARLRPRNAKRWMLETTELTFGVDGLRGPGSVAWTIAEAEDSPQWMLAQADRCGESVGLIDLERWHRVEVIPDEVEAAAPEPASNPSPARPLTATWCPA
jgi:hypothetical protein